MHSPMVRNGVHRLLEDEADRILHEALSVITRRADKSDVLTPWKEADRRKREIYVKSGVPDGSLRRGIFHRGINAVHQHLNSVEAVAPPKSVGQTDWGSEW